ncbi:MAG: hypothetical protein QOF50_696 [Gaiellaceae bacterium]|jgi:hypothetical protein|nr:hypothetical protein [Gaiellaceae bacterium]
MKEPEIGVGAYALWRGVNETIAAAARLAREDRAVFVCECGSYACVARIEATLAEYEAARLLIVAGHEALTEHAADAPMARETAHLRAVPSFS